MYGKLLNKYGLDEKNCRIIPFGNGLINQSWKIIHDDSGYLLQKINTSIFSRPEDIMENLMLLSDYFKNNHPGYLFVAPIPAFNSGNYIHEGEDYYRMFPFIKNSKSHDTVDSPLVAFEAARQFGKFTRLLSSFDPRQLKITIPGFHDLSMRYRQFESSLKSGNIQRLECSAAYIKFLKEQSEIVGIFENIKNNPSFKSQVIHHDTKINNVLFNAEDEKAICVIDLDTVMPGYFISDVGDMLRTYLSPAGEEEKDFSKIEIREEYFLEILKGYLGEMKFVLSDEELGSFVYAGKFAIYMQALRFLTDYMNNDSYYLIQYEDQNLVRAKNQIVLLKKYMEKEKQMNELVKSWLD
jgi:Ser/Thr protein kinase RdoA (MazF antagonist)